MINVTLVTVVYENAIRKAYITKLKVPEEELECIMIFKMFLFLVYRLCYDAEHVPKTKQQWESFSFIDKTHWGYYTWPKLVQAGC